MTAAAVDAGIFRVLHLPATVIDARGTIVDVNDAFLDFTHSQGLDVRREDRVGHPVWDFADVDDPHLGREAVLAVLAGQEVAPVVLTERDAAGRQARHELRIRRLTDDTGSTTGALITREEITEDLRQAQELEHTLGLLRACRTVGQLVLSSLDADVIIENIAREVVKAGIFRSVTLAVVDEAAGRVKVERAFVRHVDDDGAVIPGSALRAETDVVGLSYPLDDSNIMAETARRGQLVVTDGEDARFDARVKPTSDHPDRCCYFIPVKKAGRVLAVIATASPRDERDEILRRIEIMHPLLDQVAVALEHARLYRQTERAARDARVSLAAQRLRAEILQMQSDTDWSRVVNVLRRELRGLIDYAACGINLISDDHVVAHSAGPVVKENLVLSRVPPPVRQALDSGAPVYRRSQQEMRAIGDGPGLLDGGVHSVVDVPFGTGTLAVNHSRPQAFSDTDIEIVSQLAVVLAEGHRRLEDLRALATKEQQLQQAQKMEAVGQLTAGIAHNFNNMLQALTGNLELAKLGGDVGELLESSLETCARAAGMVHQLMVYSRQTVRAAFGDVDIIHVVGDVEAICRRTFDRRIELDIAVAEDLPTVRGDALQLEQVLLNLCINARDALEDAGTADPRIRIEVALQPDAEPPSDTGLAAATWMRLRVGDNGPGMDAATRAHIFEPFFTTKDVGRGTGLGLSTALGIVQDHGGWIGCDSRLGDGTRIDVYLAAAADPPLPEPESSPPMSDAQGSDTVLVVDDEDMVRNTAMQMLQRRGYHVLSAADGEEALAVYREHADEIALVLLDHSMPRLSGSETLQALRELSDDVGIIMITGFPAGLTEFAGADALLRKPFSLADLVDQVRSVIDARR